MDPSVLAGERLVARRMDTASDLIVSVVVVPTPYVADRLVPYDRVVGEMLDSIARITAVAPEPHLARRGRFGFLSPFGLQRSADGIEGVGFRYWHDGGFAVDVRHTDVNEGAWEALVGEGLCYAILHVGAVTWALADAEAILHVQAVAGPGPAAGDASSPASVEGVVGPGEVAAVALLGQTLADRAGFGTEVAPLPFHDADAQAALAAAINR